jgi:proteasome-associated ATPase
VLLSPSGDVVIEVLGPDPNKQQQNVVSDFRPVEWDDIGGLDDVKHFFHDIFERPLSCPHVYRAYNLPTPKGALMFGPPGCGKTLIGRAFATDLARRYGKADGGGFMSVKGPEMLSMWVGQTEQNIRELFDKARKFKQDNGFPAVIFFDEAEAIMNRRGSSKSSDVDRTIVPAFLAEMDGLQDSGAIVLLATNRPEMLDPAIIREGRIDRKVHVPRPNATASYRIMLTNLKSYPINSALSVEDLAERATEHLFSPEHSLYHIRLNDGSTRTFTLSHVTSGAMVAAIVQSAASAALNRDIAASRVEGITLDDMHAAIHSTLSQHRRMHYKDEVDEFIADYRDEVSSLDRVMR